MSIESSAGSSSGPSGHHQLVQFQPQSSQWIWDHCDPPTESTTDSVLSKCHCPLPSELAKKGKVPVKSRRGQK